MSNKCPISRHGLALTLALAILAAPLPAAAQDGPLCAAIADPVARERCAYAARQQRLRDQPSAVERERWEYRERQRRLERERGR